MSGPAPAVCPFCGSCAITLAVHSVVADSYHCPRCHLFFSVTCAVERETWVSASTTGCAHVWDFGQQGTAYSAVCRLCGALRPVIANDGWHG